MLLNMKLKSKLNCVHRLLASKDRQQPATEAAALHLAVDVQGQLHALPGASKPQPMPIKEVLTAYRKSGESKWFAMIFESHRHIVLGTAIRMLGDKDDAADAAAEVFVKAMTRLRQESPENFSGWLYMVTRNHCIELIRKRKRNPSMESLEHVVGCVEPISGLQIEAQTVWLETAVHKALQSLPRHQKTCIERFYMEGKSYQEICLLEGFDLKEVKSYLQNGKRRLMQLLAPVRSQQLSDEALQPFAW